MDLFFIQYSPVYLKHKRLVVNLHLFQIYNYLDIFRKSETIRKISLPFADQENLEPPDPGKNVLLNMFRLIIKNQAKYKLQNAL